MSEGRFNDFFKQLEELILKNENLGKLLKEANKLITELKNIINSLNIKIENLTKENEELKFALGQTENTHDLLIAQQKASTALQYTVALRDKFLESYKELMNMQI